MNDYENIAYLSHKSPYTGAIAKRIIIRIEVATPVRADSVRNRGIDLIGGKRRVKENPCFRRGWIIRSVSSSQTIRRSEAESEPEL